MENANSPIITISSLGAFLGKVKNFMFKTFATKEDLHSTEEAFSTALDSFDATFQQALADCNEVKDEMLAQRDVIYSQMDSKAEEVRIHADQQIERIDSAEATIAAAWDDLDYRIRQLETV